MTSWAAGCPPAAPRGDGATRTSGRAASRLRPLSANPLPLLPAHGLLRPLPRCVSPRPRCCSRCLPDPSGRMREPLGTRLVVAPGQKPGAHQVEDGAKLSLADPARDGVRGPPGCNWQRVTLSVGTGFCAGRSNKPSESRSQRARGRQGNPQSRAARLRGAGRTLCSRGLRRGQGSRTLSCSAAGSQQVPRLIALARSAADQRDSIPKQITKPPAAFLALPVEVTRPLLFRAGERFSLKLPQFSFTFQTEGM